MTRPRLRDVVQGEVPLKSYARLHATGDFSEELLEKILRGVSAQKYTETVIDAARAFGVSPPSVSQKMVSLTAQNLKAFQERSLAAFRHVRSFWTPSTGAARPFLSRWVWT